MENGLTIQFTNGVTGTPLGFLAHCLNGGEIDFHHHGNDHQPDEYGDGQIDLAAGPEFESARTPTKAGANVPRAIPVSMQRATYKLK